MQRGESRVLTHCSHVPDVNKKCPQTLRIVAPSTDTTKTHAASSTVDWASPQVTTLQLTRLLIVVTVACGVTCDTVLLSETAHFQAHAQGHRTSLSPRCYRCKPLFFLSLQRMATKLTSFLLSPWLLDAAGLHSGYYASHYVLDIYCQFDALLSQNLLRQVLSQ